MRGNDAKGRLVSVTAKGRPYSAQMKHFPGERRGEFWNSHGDMAFGSSGRELAGGSDCERSSDERISLKDLIASTLEMMRAGAGS